MRVIGFRQEAHIWFACEFSIFARIGWATVIFCRGSPILGQLYLR
jgi:hypothetical protein